jgi:hypothetical protein
MATAPPKGWSTGPAGMTPGQAEVGTVDSPWYLPGTGPATFTSGEGQDQTVGSRGPESIPQDMAWRQIGNQQYQTQQYGPEGLIGTPSEVNTKDPNDAIFKLLIQAGMAGVLGPLAGTLGSAVNTGLGLGLGTAGSTALGAGLVNAGKTAGGGGDFGDVAKAGLTSGAGSVLGSSLSGLPSDITGTGINALNSAATGAIKGAASSGLGALLQGNSVGDALLTGGLGGGLSGGASSAVGGTLKDMGIPDSVIRIMGPTAVAALLNKDPTGAALNTAIGQLVGSISKPPGKASGGSIEGSDMYTKHFDEGDFVQGDNVNNLDQYGGYTPPNYADSSYNNYDPFINPLSTISITDVAPTTRGLTSTGTDPFVYNAAKDSAALNDSGIAKAPGSVDLGTLGGTQSTGGLNFDLSSIIKKFGLPALLAGLAAADRQKATGGGYGKAYQSPAPLTRTMSQGKYGPIAKYAADGGMIDGYAEGGIAAMAKGRFLRGPGDGVSDSIPATIDGNQPAALADGEFVIPARVVSELGNGSSEAGARKLHEMMVRIQKDRRGAKNIAANTKVDRHLPA